MPSAFTVRTCRYLPEALELVRRFGCVTGDAVAKQLGLARGSLQYSLYCAWRHGLVTTYGISRRTRAWCDGPLRQLAGSLNGGRIAVLRVSDAAVAAMSLIERGARYIMPRRVIDALRLPRTATWAHDLVHAVLHVALDNIMSERLRTRHGGRGWLVLDLRAAVEGLSRIAESGELPIEPDPPPPPPVPRRQQRDEMVCVSIHVPHNYVDLMNILVKAGVYPSRSEIVRDAIRKLLEQYRGA